MRHFRTFVEVIEKSVLTLYLGIEVSSAPRIGKIGTYEERVDIVETRRHGPGDATAAIFWLENRRPAAWREKHRVAVTNSLEALSDEELERETQMPISGRCRRRMNACVADDSNLAELLLFRMASRDNRSSEATLSYVSLRGRGGAGDRPDVGEHAAGVPSWKFSYERRGAIELDAVIAGSLGPSELAGVPFDEGFGFRRDVEVLVEAGVRFADFGVSELDE